MPRIPTFLSRQQLPRGPLLQNLHDCRRSAHPRFVDQQVDVLGHHYIADHNKTETLAGLLQNVQEPVACAPSSEKAIAGNKNR